MEIIADGGSTKVDWVVLNNNKQEVFRVRSEGLNPAVVSKEQLKLRLLEINELIEIKDQIKKIHFYGAGCGTPIPLGILSDLFSEVFINAEINVAEDMLAAVYAASFNKESIVCILGTGSNSCYYNGKTIEGMIPSLGYTVMDEASGNYFGKILLRDYFYKKMPKKLRKDAFMFSYKEEKYTKKIIKKGFDTFLNKRVLIYKKQQEIPIYFIGSIAYYFKELLEKSAKKHNLNITNIIQRPLDNLIKYHQDVI